MLSRKRRARITQLRRATSPKKENLNCTVAKAWKVALNRLVKTRQGYRLGRDISVYTARRILGLRTEKAFLDNLTVVKSSWGGGGGAWWRGINYQYKVICYTRFTSWTKDAQVTKFLSKLHFENGGYVSYRNTFNKLKWNEIIKERLQRRDLKQRRWNTEFYYQTGLEKSV
jgi:hypothetical protein